jgi:hypothetical protein
VPRLIARLILVPAGIVLAAFTALFVLTAGLVSRGHLASLIEQAFATLLRHVTTFPGNAPGEPFSHVLMGFWGTASILVAAPVALVALIGEITGMTGAILYVAATGIAYGLIPVLAMNNMESAGFVSPGFAASGFCAGLVYWLVAGRGAGRGG